MSWHHGKEEDAPLSIPPHTHSLLTRALHIAAFSLSLPALMGRRGLGSRLRRREVDSGHGARSLGSLEVRIIRLEAGPSREDVVGELLDEGVVVLQAVVVTLARDGDAVLGSREFVLQAHEVFV